MSASVFGQPIDAATAWQRVLDADAAHNANVTSFQAEYTVTEPIPDPRILGPDLAEATQAIRSTHYARSGDRFYQHLNIEYVIPNGPNATLWREVAFDGHNAMVRSSQAPTLIQTGSDKALQQLLELPPQRILELVSIEQLAWMLENNRIKLVNAESSRVNEQDVVSITFVSAGTGHKITIDYAPALGFLPVRAREWDRAETLVNASRINRTIEVTDDSGGRHFIPVSGSRSIGAGPQAAMWELAVDAASVRINHEIDSARFELDVTPNTQFHARDLRVDFNPQHIEQIVSQTLDDQIDEITVPSDESSSTGAATTTNDDKSPSQSAAPGTEPRPSEDKGDTSRTTVLVGLVVVSMMLVAVALILCRRRT